MGPIHQARHDICVNCPFWTGNMEPPDVELADRDEDEEAPPPRIEQDRCQDVLDDPQFGADANKVALAPWKWRRECETWEEKGV